MKKRALHKDIYMTVRRTLPRFLSIFFIVVLGVAFYAGIRVTEKDMKITADAQFDQTHLMDLKILGTMGLSQENLQAIRGLSEIEDAEGSNSVDAVCQIEGSDDEYVTKVLAQTQRMNQVEITKGNMPSKTNECVVDEYFAKQHHLKIGDILVLNSGTEKKIEDSLKESKLKITGIGKSSAYLSRERGTTEIGSGTISGFVVVKRENFKQDVYTEIYISVKNAKQELAYTSDYDHIVAKAKKQVESISKQQNQIRLKQIQEDALEEIRQQENDYKKERKKALEKLEKAEKKLQNAEKKIKEAKQELAENEKKLKQGKQEIKAGWAAYTKGKKQLSDGKKQLAGAQSELSKKESELQKGERELKQQEESLNKLEEQIAAYEQSVGADHPQVLAMKQKLSEGRKAVLEAKRKIADGKKQVTAAKTKLKTTKEKLKKNEQKLTEAKKELQKNEKKLEQSQSQLEQGKRQIQSSEKEWKKGKKEFASSRSSVIRKLNEGQKKITDARKEVQKMEKGEWYVLNRKMTQSYVEYGEDTARIGAIGEVVPSIFFLVAALVSLTTMTRMVEEQRTQIGVLKALGYTGWDVALKYVSYALAATLSGSVVGAVLGEKLLPKIIIEAYKMMYVGLGDIKTPLETEYTLMASIAAIGVVILAVLSACYKELREKPAQLMRPAAPKEGKRIFLEYIGVVWNRLNFIWKATMRNLFRYKKRFFMTIFGIGGCMALLLVGFGLMDSIYAVSDNQYRKITTYDIAVTLKDDINEREKEQFEKWILDQKEIQKHLEVHETSVSLEAGGKRKTASLTVPLSIKDFPEFFTLQDRTSGEKYHLNDEGVIITEKAASLMGIKAGDFVYLKTDETNKVRVKVQAVTENYMYHKIYMSPGLYEELYKKKPNGTKIYCNTIKMLTKEQNQIGKRILSQKAASSIVFASNEIKTMEDMIGNLNVVMIVLIISAGLLAFVVLYNLNNINISERRAELATIKVLGFYDTEVSAYVYRENILLTIIGIFAGIGLGIILHRYVILTAEIDLLMFGREIFRNSYIYSILLTIGFSIIINLLMFFQLKKIDMVESLKSAE